MLQNFLFGKMLLRKLKNSKKIRYVVDLDTTNPIRNKRDIWRYENDKKK